MMTYFCSPHGNRRPSRTLDDRGFTFAEALAAIVFTAIVIPVALQGLSLAERAGVAAQRMRIAAQLAEQKLNETIVMDTWRDGNKQGDFGIEWPGYRWMLEQETWNLDAMQLVTLTVFFEAQNHEYRVSLSTLVDENADTQSDTGQTGNAQTSS